MCVVGEDGIDSTKTIQKQSLHFSTHHTWGYLNKRKHLPLRCFPFAWWFFLARSPSTRTFLVLNENEKNRPNPKTGGPNRFERRCLPCSSSHCQTAEQQTDHNNCDYDHCNSGLERTEGSKTGDTIASCVKSCAVSRLCGLYFGKHC